MKYTDIEKTLVFLAYNLKGKKKKKDDWITIAKKCKEAVDHFNSYQEVAERTGTHPVLIRSIVRLLDLPTEVQDMLKERKIGMDIAQRIAGIKNSNDQINVAKQSIDLSSHDARSLVAFAKRNPNASIEKYKKHKDRLIGSKRKTERTHITLISLEDETYKRLEEFAKNRNISTENLIKEILKKSLKE